ncbi:MAG: hypothetical protein KBT48_02800, partial [Firmicutes bacterium]|nr:hypothetical protein [Bacillota bacterium]
SSSPILLHCQTRLNQPIYVIKEEASMGRTYADIENIIVRKKEFRNKLSILHINEPEDKNSADFIYYLQFVYFFYIMTYFVFPKLKFFDLFKEKNWSSENTMQSDTGNELFEHFILQNIYEDPFLKELYLKKIASYDEEWGHCNDRFYEYYEKEYSNKEASKEYQELFKPIIESKIDEIHNRVYPKCLSMRRTETLFDRFFDFDQSYNSKSINADFLYNYTHLDYEAILNVYEHIQEIDPELERYYVLYEEIEEVINEDVFVCDCMHVDHLTPTTINKYKKYPIKEAILNIWDFEKTQLEEFPDSTGFTFIQEYEGNYIMNYSDLLIIAMTCIYIPYTISFYSKRTDLYDRSDSSKKKKHSIKESYKVIDQQTFTPKNSSVRDAMFRILCKMEQSLYKYGNPNEFLYYEVPMNIMVFRIMEYGESLPTIEQRTQYYKYFIEEMAK